MSLILEALRKLEREKQTPERGLLVVGATQWARPRAARPPIVLFLLGVLIGAALLGIWRWRSAVPSPPPPVTMARAAAPPTTAAAAPPSVPPTAPPAPTTEPLAATPAPSPTAPTFTLQAISERDGRPVAIVNERLVREGDSIDGAQIVKIGIAQVEIEVAGRRIVLKF